VEPLAGEVGLAANPVLAVFDLDDGALLARDLFLIDGESPMSARSMSTAWPSAIASRRASSVTFNRPLVHSEFLTTPPWTAGC